MLSRLIAIMVAVSFVIIPAYAQEEATATETEKPAVEKAEKVALFDQLREAYEKNDREAMGKILDQMQECRTKMRQRRGEYRRGQQGRGFGPSQGKFGRGRGYRQMGPWQQGYQERGGWNKGPGQYMRGMHGRGGWDYRKDFGYGSRARRWHRGGGRFSKAGCDWNRLRFGHAGRRFGYGPRWKRHQWSDTDSERPARYKQRSEWDW